MSAGNIMSNVPAVLQEELKQCIVSSIGVNRGVSAVIKSSMSTVLWEILQLVCMEFCRRYYEYGACRSAGDNTSRVSAVLQEIL
jgi:hypothetical protein